MRNIYPSGHRFVAATNLRDAAVTLLHKKGEQSQEGEGRLVFEEHSPQNPAPRLSVSLSRNPADGRKMLDVWAMLKGSHAKVLNVQWLGDEVQVVSFRRGEWETELLAMGRAAGITLH